MGWSRLEWPPISRPFVTTWLRRCQIGKCSMSRELAVPSTLQLLEQRLRTGSSSVDLIPPLRTLQRLGLSQAELQVHVERIRAMNDATNQDPRLEESALLALDMISGQVSGVSLRWDA